MEDVTNARKTFRKLHESGCFVIPNPWDAGSARYLQQLGFKALATTSSGFAFSRGQPDEEQAVGRDAVLTHLREVVAATDLPVNADFQAGHGRDARGVAESVRLCVETGVAGLSIEDATGDPAKPLYELSEAVERVKAARAAIDRAEMARIENAPGAPPPTPVLLTARAECYLVGHPAPLGESIRRLEAYAEAGADVLYAPGPRRREEIAAMVAAVAPRPLNVLMSAKTGITLVDLADIGVRRVSVGSALFRAAWTAFMRVAKSLAERGTFEEFDGIVSHSELDALFREAVAAPTA